MSSKRTTTDSDPTPYPNQSLFLYWKQKHNVFKYSNEHIQIVNDGSLITKANTDSGKIMFDRPILVTDNKESLGIELSLNKVKKSNTSIEKIKLAKMKRDKAYTDSRKQKISCQSADSSSKKRKSPARKKPKADTGGDVAKKPKIKELKPYHERTVEDCSTVVGKFVMQLVERMRKKDDLLKVINVDKQRDEKSPWELYQVANHFETALEDRDFCLNQTSYEISKKDIAPILTPPTLVRELDFTYLVPQNIQQNKKFCHVQKYIITSSEFAYMDFHLDFSGSSVWYTVIDGEKWWCLVKPTEEVLKEFEDYYKDDKEGEEFFVDRVARVLGIDKNSPAIKDYILFVEQKKGQTIFIPSGWIHAVHTPVDTLAIGGNFLNGYAIKLQADIHMQDKRMETAERFKFPHFEIINYYAAYYYYEEIQVVLQNLPKKVWGIPQTNISLREMKGLVALICFLEKTVKTEGGVETVLVETINGKKECPLLQEAINDILEKTGSKNCREFFDKFRTRFANYGELWADIMFSLRQDDTDYRYDPFCKEPMGQQIWYASDMKPCCWCRNQESQQKQPQENVINLADTSSESSQAGTTSLQSDTSSETTSPERNISSAAKKQSCVNSPSSRSFQTATASTPVLNNFSPTKKNCCLETESRNNNMNGPSNRSLQAAETLTLFAQNPKDSGTFNTDQKKPAAITHKPLRALPDDIQSGNHQHTVPPQIVVAGGNPSLNPSLNYYEHHQQEIISEITSPGNNTKTARPKRMSEYSTLATDERKRTTKIKYSEYYDPSIVRLYGSKAIMLKELVLKQTFSNKILGAVEAKTMTLCLPNKVCVVKVELDLSVITQLEEFNKKKLFVFDRKGIDLRHTHSRRQYDTINFNVLVSYNTFTDNKCYDTVFLTRGNVPSLLAWAPSIDLIKETISEEEVWIPYYDAMVQASKFKPNIPRGEDKIAISEIYMCFGQRRNRNDSDLGEYAFKPNTDEKIEQEIVSRVKALVQAIEKITAHLFDNLSITGLYRDVVDKYKIRTMVKDGLTVAFCAGYNYASAIHKDKDAFYNTISCYNKYITERETVVYNVCFPEYGFSVQLYNGSVLVYDPQFGHCVSNPVCAGTFIMSCFVSARTVQAFVSKGEADGFSFPINFSK